MVMGEENFTAKAQRAQRKQLMLTGVECSPRRREGREEEPFMVTGGEVLTAKARRAQRRAVYADGGGDVHREGAKGAKGAKKSRLC